VRSSLKKFLEKIKLKSFAIFLRTFYRELLSKHSWANLEKSTKIFLELGSGAKKGANGWTTVDLGGADICHDLTKGIPLPNASVDRIYTSPMLEHIPFNDLVSFIKECYRVLKLGGELSVCVPNAGNYINAYVEKRQFSERDKCYLPAIVDTGSCIDQVNYIAYMGGQHNYLFDEENLINTIKTSPFKSVVLRKFDADIDIESRDYESIYASAIK